MTNQNPQLDSTGFSEIIEEISMKTADQLYKKQEVSELKSLQEQMVTLKQQLNDVVSQKSKLTSYQSVEVSATSPYFQDLEQAFKTFDNANNNTTKITLNEKKIFNALSDVKAANLSQVMNTYNGVQGGYSVMTPSYAGLINVNAITYAPMLALCGRAIETGLNGSFYIGYDNTNINVAYAKEAVEFDASKLATISPLTIQLDAVSGYHPYSKRLMRAVNRGETYFNFILHNEEVLQEAIDRKINNEIIKELKVESKYKKTFTTATSNVLTFDDLFELAASGLKPIYERNSVFVCSRSTLAHLAKLKGDNGQYVWRDVYEAPSSGVGLATVSSPAGTIKILGISALADENFDAFVTGGSNQNKIIGVYADFSQFIKVAYSDTLQYSVQEVTDANLAIKDMGLFVKTAYVGFERSVQEAGVVVKVKS